MSKSTRSSVIFAAILLSICSCLYAQSPAKTKNLQKEQTKTSFTLNMQKKAGTGPSGNVSIGIGSFDPNNETEESRGYPKIKNKPAGLHGVVNYFYKLNDFQFYYQAYCAGTYSKEFFMGKVGQQKWNLADTTKLSKNAIKCGFSVMAGYNDANEVVYIIDSDGDADFGNDVLMPALKRSSRNEDGAVKVITEFASGNKIQQEHILVLPFADDNGKNGTGEIEMSFAFPEFRYARFNHLGQSYFVCTDGLGMGREFIYILPDAPNFSSAKSETKLTLDQSLRIGDKSLRFTGYENNGNQISLTVGIADDVISSSAQIGFMAPIIKGYNFLDSNTTNLTTISTAELKGKYVFVDFWSTFCGPCIAEFPYLKAVYQKYARDKFEIIGILDDRDSTVTSRLSKEGNLIWPNIKTNTKSTDVSGYKITSYPTSYLIDPEGKIIATNLRGEELANKLKTLIK